MFYGFIKFPLSKGQTGLFHQPIIIMDPMKQFGIKLFLFALLQSFTFLLFFYCWQKSWNENIYQPLRFLISHIFL